MADCGSINNITALSIFTGSTSGLMMLLSVILNSLLIYCLVTERKKKYKSFFYKLLLNIAVADFLTGCIVDCTGMVVMVKEALRLKIEHYETYLSHISLFYTDAVALLTLSILSVERIIALLYPIQHFRGINVKYEYLLVFIPWSTAWLVILPYFFYHDFISQLLVFSAVNIVLCSISLIANTITYRTKNLKIKTTNSNIPVSENREYKGSNSQGNQTKTEEERMYKPSLSMSKPSQHEEPYEESKLSVNCKSITEGKSKNITLQAMEIQNRQSTEIQNKATRTFIYMLCVFVFTYIPTCITMILMNTCNECSCVFIHVMRDVSILFIQSSSILRPLNFILTLKHLRASVASLIRN